MSGQLRRASARGGSRIFVIWIVVAALAAAAPSLGLSPVWSRQIMLVCLVSLVASGLIISFGYAGELSFGQVAMYAAGAYAGGFVAVHVFNDMILVLLAGALAGVVFGLVSGIPGLRIGGWVLGVASFFLVILIPDMVQWFPREALGGYEGLTGIPLPVVLGIPLTSQGFYVAVVLVTVGWFALFRNMVKSRFGSALLVMKQSPVLAESLGMSVYRLKLTAYAVGAIPAGLAGGMFAYLDGYVAPDSFSLTLTISILAACIIAGTTSVYGLVIGAAFIQVLLGRTDIFKDFSTVAFGVFLIIGGVAIRGGLSGLFTLMWRRTGLTGFLLRRALAQDTFDPSSQELAIPQVDGRLLTVDGAAKSFGGNPALRGVSFQAQPGQITALIGPNGSGKTTMLNVIGGFYPLDDGRVSLGDEKLTGLSSDKVSRTGVARTFQTPAIPSGLTVEEVLLSARLTTRRVALLAVALRLPSYHRTVAVDREVVRRILLATGLWERRFDIASDLSLGTRRMLELARALVREPSVILLDEVASGLDIDEVVELDAVLRRVRDAGATVVLVEHNFSLVRAISDRVVVLAEGAVVMDGTPDEVESDPEVRRHYLGESIAISGTSLRVEEKQS